MPKKKRAQEEPASTGAGRPEPARTVLAKAAVRFLDLICAPAAEEVGILLRDQMRHWRRANALRLLQAAKLKHDAEAISPQATAHPRLVAEVIEYGSLCDDGMLQDLWGGLLTSSCSEDGRDESNLIFVNILRQLTSSEAKLLKYACERAQKEVLHGLIWVPEHTLICKREDLYEITGVTDIDRLDRELDHLRALDLIVGGFQVGHSNQANITPRPFALHMYVRCQGSRASPIQYFGLSQVAS